MILPMFGLLFSLLVVGALGALVAVNDQKHARLAPYIGFISLFAGLGALVSMIGLGVLGAATGWLFGTVSFGPAGALGGYFLGLLGGALVGLRKALRHGRPPYIS